MPGMTGLDVVRTIGADDMPPTIFVTAFDQHALQAFDLAALDYLVKPFDDERFEQAFRRARRFTALEDTGRLHEQLLSVLRGEARAYTPSSVALERVTEHHIVDRIPIESRGKVKFLPVSRRRLHHRRADRTPKSSPPDESISFARRCRRLEDRLDPSQFTRIHRSTIVRLDRVDTLHKAPAATTTFNCATGLDCASAGRVGMRSRQGLAFDLAHALAGRIFSTLGGVDCEINVSTA